MAQLWDKWIKRRETRDYWNSSYKTEQADFNWIRQWLAVVIIFTLVYGAHLSGSVIGNYVDSGIKYVLTAQPDWGYIAERAAGYIPADLDLFQKVRTTISKPADPLDYLIKPVNGPVVAGFGWWTHPVLKQEMMHEGITIEAPLGTNIRAAAPGKVKSINDTQHFGKVIIIEHSKQVDSIYGHLGEVLVANGDMISQGQVIAKVGKTGLTANPALYFEVRENGKAVDPLPKLKGDLPAQERK